MSIRENIDPLEPRLPPDGLGASATRQSDPDVGYDDLAAIGEDGEIGLSDHEVLTYLGDAKRMARNYQQVAVMQQWEMAEAHWRSEHHAGSKYRKDQYKNRAKYFKPKPRAAVLKALSHTRAALLSSSDIVAVDAEDASNPLQQANAALLKEVIDARFGNKTRRTGVPWARLVLGARRDCQVLGACASKQTWRYRYVEKQVRRVVEQPVLGMDGQPVIDFLTRQPRMEQVEQIETVRDVIEDKPVIELLPLEMVLINPATNWIDPAQDSPTLQLIMPMHVDALRAMMDETGGKTETPWRPLREEDLAGAMYSEDEINGLKTARDGNADRMGQQYQSKRRGPGRFGGGAGEVVEVWENFFRVDGVDYQCWSLKNTALLSDPVPVEEVYPAHRGARPVVIGTDTVEPHVLFPESHVASWRETTSEINDLSNIRMDAVRQATFPMAKVKAGRNIDYKTVQRRDSNGVVLVRDENDVTWDRAPAPPGQLYEEVDRLSNDMDELAGNFSQNSVQSNREIGETVGGMQLIAANAGATSELFLSMFVETWAEQVMSQVVMLLQYYEDDATLLMVAGQKAKLFQKFGVSEINDELLESQVTLSINVGVGATDPMMRLMKFRTVMEIAMPYVLMAKEQGKADIRFDEIFGEIFGQAGFRNGTERFIEMIEGDPSMPAEQAKQMIEQMKAMQAELEEAKSEREIDMGKLRIDAEKVKIDREKLEIERAKAMAEIEDEDAERMLERDKVLLEAGLPPGFSLEQEQEMNQQQINALLADGQATRNTIAQLAEAMVRQAQSTDQALTRIGMQVGAQSNALMEGLQSLQAAQSAPKRVIYDDQGRPTGVETVGA